MLIPPEKMTRESLEARERMHLEMAYLYESHSEHSMAAKFRELAAVYRRELDTRPPAPESDRAALRRQWTASLSKIA